VSGISTGDVDRIIDLALVEDVGSGDVTSLATIPAGAVGRATAVTRGPGVVAGLAVFGRVFERVDRGLEVRSLVRDGARVEPGTRLATVQGPARAILTGERTALNFLQHLSGIATRTAMFARLVAGTRARIVDTRKTVPGLRALAKDAVRAGGGHNHRFGLYDGVLIKDNYIRVAGGIKPAVDRARALVPHLLRIEVEAETLEEVREALEAGAEVVMLDNMSTEQMREAVLLCQGRALTEASGGITEKSVRAVAEAGVDLISIGALTHSVAALDIGLDWEE
jgi:nicotinate-nucleotide pyrophosphorylase (carboxylating)